jgi:mannosylglycerate hydrolase
VCGTQFGRVVRAAHDADVVSPIETIPPWHPFRDWLVAPGSKAGLAVVAPGLFEVGLPQHPYLALTLWRSVGWLSRPDLPFRPGDAGPAMETPGGQCLRPMTFSYALAAVDRDLVLADGMPVWQAAHLAAHPPMAWAVDVRGARPEDAWLLHVPAPEIVLSSIRRWRESGPVRVTLYNATDRAVSATVEAGFRFRTVRRCNMLSQPVRPESVAVRGSALDVAFGPFEIVCLEFEPA